MAAEGPAPAGPIPYFFKKINYPADLPCPDSQEPNFVSPLEESQESQNRVSAWQNRGSSIGGVGANGESQTGDALAVPSLPPFATPFLTRPRAESPDDFSTSFQYAKPSGAQISSFRTKATAPPIAIDHELTSKDETSIHVDNSPCEPDSSLFVNSSSGHDSISEIIKPSIEADPCPRSGECEQVEISSSSPAPLKKESQNSDRSHNSGQSGNSAERTVASNPPILVSPHFVSATPIKHTPQHQNDGPGKPKLSKSFVDIQRKALIQSSPMKSTIVPAHASSFSNAQGASSSQPHGARGKGNEKYGKARMQTERHVGQPAQTSTVRRPLQSEKSCAHGKSSHGHRHNADIARPVTRDTNKSHEMPLRPFSVSSNVSRRRDPIPSQGLEPCRTPTSRCSSRTTGISDAVKVDFAKAYNKMILFNERKNSHWKAKQDAMKKQIAEQDARINHYLGVIQQQEESIKDLESAKEQQQKAIHQARDATHTESEKVKALKDKMKEYRCRLNAAIHEQQELFKQVRAKHHEVISQIAEKERSCQQSVEEALSVTEKSRNDMRQKIDELKLGFHSEVEKLKIDIEISKAQLADRENDVARGNEHVSELRQELAKSQDLNRDVMESLRASNSQLIEQGRQAAAQMQNMERCVSQQDEKIQAMLDLLKDKQEASLTIPEMMEALKSHQSETIKSALAELREDHLSEQQVSLKAVEDLRKDMASIHELYSGLSQQLQLQSSRMESEWQGKLDRAEHEHGLLLQEADRLREELNEALKESTVQAQQHDGVRQQLTALQAETKELGKLKGQTETLEKEKYELHSALRQREASIQALERKLEEAGHSLRIQKDHLDLYEKKLSTAREQHAKAISINQEEWEKAVKQATTEASSKIRADYKGIEKRLQDALAERDRLQEELNQKQQNADATLQESINASTCELRGKLAEMDKVVDELSMNLQAVEESRNQLQSELEASRKTNEEASLLKSALEQLSSDVRRTCEGGSQLERYFHHWESLQRTCQWHQSENQTVLLEVIEASRSNSDHDRMDIKVEPHLWHDGTRRVVVQSPVCVGGVGEAMDTVTVLQEQFNRRRVVTPKGILKAFSAEDILVDQQKLNEIEVAPSEPATPSERRRANRPAKLGPVSHSAYNRPVIGNLAGDESKSEYDQVLDSQEIAPAAIPAAPLKRRRNEGDVPREQTASSSTNAARESNTSGKRMKLAPSLSPYFHGESSLLGPEMESVQRSQLQLRPTRGEPLKRKTRSGITYGAIETRSQKSVPANPLEGTDSGGLPERGLIPLSSQ